jgi:copper chaperone CopZ
MAPATAIDAPSLEAVEAYASDPTPIRTPTATMAVHGLSCPLCASNVDKQLLRMPGVESVSVDLYDGKLNIRVSQDAPPTRGDLAKAIHESGFTLIKIEEP